MGMKLHKKKREYLFLKLNNKGEKMYKKIDIYLLNRGRKTFVYECSTNWSKTCKEAKGEFLRKENMQ
jgi:hypothetical protein